jgi:hypothetical protein
VSTRTWDNTEGRSRQGEQRVQFARGFSSAQILGNLPQNSEYIYILRAKNGQYMNISSNTPNISFQLFAPDGNILSELQSQPWSGTISQSGDYRIKIVTGPNLGADFQLNVSIKSGE